MQRERVQNNHVERGESSYLVLIPSSLFLFFHNLPLPEPLFRSSLCARAGGQVAGGDAHEGCTVQGHDPAQPQRAPSAVGKRERVLQDRHEAGAPQEREAGLDKVRVLLAHHGDLLVELNGIHKHDLPDLIGRENVQRLDAERQLLHGEPRRPLELGREGDIRSRSQCWGSGFWEVQKKINNRKKEGMGIWGKGKTRREGTKEMERKG